MAGVGTNVARCLSFIGYKQEQGCGCKSLQGKLDRWGPDKCQRNYEWIIEALKRQAEKLEAPWSDTGARAILGTSIMLARVGKKIGREQVPTEADQLKERVSP